jgi:DNA-binding XRE family transcriptional regulator
MFVKHFPTGYYSAMETSRVFLPHLRAWRMYSLMSMVELSEAAKVSRDTLIQLELQRNRANFSTVGKLADALHITRRQLVYEQPPASEGQ